MTASSSKWGGRGSCTSTPSMALSADTSDTHACRFERGAQPNAAKPQRMPMTLQMHPHAITHSCNYGHGPQLIIHSTHLSLSHYLNDLLGSVIHSQFLSFTHPTFSQAVTHLQVSLTDALRKPKHTTVDADAPAKGQGEQKKGRFQHVDLGGQVSSGGLWWWGVGCGGWGARHGAAGCGGELT
jgi:hypothetical protein